MLFEIRDDPVSSFVVVVVVSSNSASLGFRSRRNGSHQRREIAHGPVRLPQLSPGFPAPDGFCLAPIVAL